MQEDLIYQIRHGAFSKSQKRIAAYVLEHYDKAAFMTAATLGDMADVSESTVVRFAYELGYEGYPQFQKALQELIRNRLTSVQRMEVASTKMGEMDILKSVLQSDIDKLKSTVDEVDAAAFAGAVEIIGNADTIYVLGARTCSPLASFFGFYLNLIFPNVRIVASNSASETFEQVYRVGKNDVVIGISYPRYSRRTVAALQYAAERGAQVVAITDSMSSPITRYASHTLIARSDMSTFVDSLVAPLSIINALVVALVMRNKEEVGETFQQLENIWDAYDVYEKNIDG